MVSALKPVRRQFTAREAAERLGVTTRTVQRLMA
ncbi:replication protein RepB, partial [Corynebacterium diphtheriae]